MKNSKIIKSIVFSLLLISSLNASISRSVCLAKCAAKYTADDLSCSLSYGVDIAVCSFKAFLPSSGDQSSCYSAADSKYNGCLTVSSIYYTVCTNACPTE